MWQRETQGQNHRRHLPTRSFACLATGTAAALTKAALAAGQEAAAVKEARRRQAEKAKLSAEIEKARSALARYEERMQSGEDGSFLKDSIEKSKGRISQMESALNAMADTA